MRLRALLAACVIELSFCGTALAAPLYESYQPAGGRPSEGLIITIHGGAWTGVGQYQLDKLHPVVARMQKRGWSVLNIDYRPGGKESFADVLSFYDWAHAVNQKKPICLYGESAGAHMAMLLAEQRSVQCTIALAGPTDLSDWHASSPSRAATTDYAAAIGRQAFGPGVDSLRQYSPLYNAASLHGKLLLVGAKEDPLVPITQEQRMLKKVRGAKLLTLSPGAKTFIHSKVNTAQFKRYLGAEAALMASVSAR